MIRVEAFWGLDSPIGPTGNGVPGVACEVLPSRNPPAAGGPGGWDVNCGNFATWAKAQGWYEAHGGNNVAGLDADYDGIACESLP